MPPVLVFRRPADLNDWLAQVSAAARTLSADEDAGHHWSGAGQRPGRPPRWGVLGWSEV